MGAIVREQPKGSGVYYVFISHNNRRKAKKVGLKERADKLARSINAKIELGIFNLKSTGQPNATTTPTVAEYTLISIDRRYPATKQNATNSRYKSVLKKDLCREFGDKPINEVSPLDIWNLIEEIGQSNRTSSSIGLTRTVLSLCFSMATLEKLIPTNPMKDVPRRTQQSGSSRDEQTPYKINPMTEEQMIKFIDGAMEYSPAMYGPLFLCGFRTGMRLGELLALKWEHVDWERGVISVYQSHGREGLGKTKTRKAREVDMSNQLQEILEDLLCKRRDEAKKSAEKKIPAIIFHSKGDYRSHNATRKAFKKVLAIAGLPDKRVHDMRHTYASILLSKGASIYYIKDQLGHKKISMTSDFYSRFIPGTNRDMVSILDTPLGTKRHES